MGWDGGIILRQLCGSWSLTRQIDDPAGARQGDMSGEAVFARVPDNSVSYYETGALRLADGQIFDAERRYIFTEKQNGFAVHFFETPPRLFHKILLIRDHDSWIGEASHLCGDDLYDSHYRFDPGDIFFVTHHVRGPRKNYVSTSSFARSGKQNSTF